MFRFLFLESIIKPRNTRGEALGANELRPGAKHLGLGEKRGRIIIAFAGSFSRNKFALPSSALGFEP